MLKSLFRRSQPLDVNQALQQAVASHQRGALGEAEALYRAILDAQPEHFDARHLLGVVRLQQQRPDEAYALIAEALQARPSSPEALSNAGLALHAMKRHGDAVGSFDRAIGLKPDYADAHFNRGHALSALGRHEEALTSYDRVLSHRQDHAGAWAYRAMALVALDRSPEAIASYDRALALRPDSPDVLNSYGNLLASNDRFDEAIACYDRALGLRPDSVDALNNRGNALHAQGRDQEAVADYGRALSIVPRFADARFNRGVALAAQQRHDEAIADFDEALSARPGNVEALYNRALSFGARGDRDESIADYQQVLAIQPDHVDALYNLGIVLNERGRLSEALAQHEKALALNPDIKHLRGSIAFKRAQLCEWDGFERFADGIVRDVEAGKRVCRPFEFMALSHDPAAQLQCARLHARDTAPGNARPLWNGERYRHDRIRIAYLSANFHEHAVAYLMAGLFEGHDRTRFEISGISFGPPQEDAMRARLKASFERFIDVREQTDEEVATALRAMEIDVAIDLMGYTKDGRPNILAWRPAPVQVNYLGFPATMGADFIDYIIADAFVIPPEKRRDYAEHVVYLPDTYQVNDRLRRIGDVTPARGALGLPERGFVFCSFNSSYKIRPAIFGIWTRLLREVEGSVLWILSGDPVVERNLRREAEARGIAPSRLVFAPRVDYEDHLPRYRAADLFLDSLPCNAGATASEALWAGLPVLTCSGSAFVARMAGSLLTALKLPELVTQSLADYENQALALATQPSLLASLRERLARNIETATVFDTDRFRRHIESAYVSMWERSQRGEAPASFAVQPIN